VCVYVPAFACVLLKRYFCALISACIFMFSVAVREFASVCLSISNRWKEDSNFRTCAVTGGGVCVCEKPLPHRPPAQNVGRDSPPSRLDIFPGTWPETTAPPFIIPIAVRRPAPQPEPTPRSGPQGRARPGTRGTDFHGSGGMAFCINLCHVYFVFWFISSIFI